MRAARGFHSSGLLVFKKDLLKGFFSCNRPRCLITMFRGTSGSRESYHVSSFNDTTLYYILAPVSCSSVRV